MPAAVIRKLQQFTRLSGEERHALEELLGTRVRRVPARRDIAREGDRVESVQFILSGWACRYRLLEDGRRQTTAFFLPGDLCDCAMVMPRRMYHSVGALTSVRVAEVPHDRMTELATRHPGIAQALGWCTLVAQATEHEWIVNLGLRTATERMSHLFCELYLRSRTAGLVPNGGCSLPLTQADLADALGMSIVHVNRTLQELRNADLVEIDRRELRIPDFDRLRSLALFDPAYLHLDRDGDHLDTRSQPELRLM